MAATNYYAMSIGKKRVFCNLLAGIPYKGSIAVTNQGNLPLNDVKVEVLHTGFECTRTFTPIATLAGKTTGKIAINAKNANGVQLPYSIEPVSNKNGTLHIEVCDEYTYYSEGPPR